MEQFGRLQGLITVKDVLRFSASLEHAHEATETWDDYRGSLNTLLEESWVWTSDLWQQILGRGRNIFGRYM